MPLLIRSSTFPVEQILSWLLATLEAELNKFLLLCLPDVVEDDEDDAVDELAKVEVLPR